MYPSEERSDYPRGGSLSATTPVKTSEVQRELERLDKTVAELDSVIESLGSRLSPISRSPNPTTDGQAKSPECSTPIGIALMQIREKIQYKISHIVDLRDRLEI